MSVANELYGIDDETYNRLVNEMVENAGGKSRRETVIRMVNELSTAKRDQREIVVLAVMLGMITRGR